VELSYDIAALPAPFRGRALQHLAGRLTGTVLTVSASAQRSQWQNRGAAQRRLIDLLRAATAPPPAARRPTKPTRGSVERRLAEKKNRARTKQLRRSDGD